MVRTTHCIAPPFTVRQDVSHPSQSLNRARGYRTDCYLARVSNFTPFLSGNGKYTSPVLETVCGGKGPEGEECPPRSQYATR